MCRTLPYIKMEIYVAKLFSLGSQDNRMQNGHVNESLGMSVKDYLDWVN